MAKGGGLMEEVRRLLEIDKELETRGDGFVRQLTPPSGFQLIRRRGEEVRLPEPKLPAVPFGEVVVKRRSRRHFSPSRGLDLGVVSALLYSAVGVTSRVDGIYGMLDYPLRASPSAGGLHCVDVYPVAFRVDGLAPGVYYYDYERHGLVSVCSPCFFHTLPIVQSEIKNAPLHLILVGDLRRGVWKYGRAFYRMCLLDAGAVAENIHLAATAMGLASVIVAGIEREKAQKALGLEEGEIVIAAVSVGYADY